MGTTHREVERKYEPASPDTALPDLAAVGGVASVAPGATVELDATYFDGPALPLARSGVTLRRRLGGDDEGWHLKLPTAGDKTARDEVQLPLGRARRTVPKGLRTAVRAYLLDVNPVAVASIRTERTEYALCDGDGRTLAVVADDKVSARRLVGAGAGSGEGAGGGPDEVGEEAVLAWREWEVELVHGPESLLDEVEAVLLRAGAQPAAAPSKLARVLGGTLRATGEAHPVVPAKELSSSDPAGALVRARLAEQVAVLKRRDVDVRRDVEDGVHQMRVAIRRLRSALASYRPLLDRSVTEQVRDELKWLGQVLGDARDAEVMHERLRELVAAEPVELLMGDVVSRIDVSLGRAYREAHEAAVEALASERYDALLRALDRLVAEPPFSQAADEPASDVLPQRVRHDFERLRKRVKAAAAADGSSERDAALHEVRKAAKRARYAAETMAPVWGKPASRFVKAAKKVQSALGDHQDAVVLRSQLRQLAVQAQGEGDNAFSFGRMHALEQARAAAAEEKYAKAWAKLSSKKLRRKLG